MDSRDLAKLACRILSLYFIITVLISLPWMLTNLIGLGSGQSGQLMAFLVTLASFLTNLAVGLLLWWKTERVASWLAPTPKEVNLGGLSLPTLQRLAFSVVGIVFAARGLAALAQYGALGFSDEYSNAFGVGPVRSGIELIVGLWLLLGVDGLVNLLGRLEQNRISPPQKDNEPQHKEP